MSIDSKTSLQEYILRDLLKDIARKHGISVLGERRLKGIIMDEMGQVEHIDIKHLNVFKRAIDDQVGARLLEMGDNEAAIKNIKSNNLRETFKNNNALDDTAYRVYDCLKSTIEWHSKQKDKTLPFKPIRIGYQAWADRNLDVTHFRNGDPIPEARTHDEWMKAGKEGKPAWCHLIPGSHPLSEFKALKKIDKLPFYKSASTNRYVAAFIGDNLLITAKDFNKEKPCYVYNNPSDDTGKSFILSNKEYNTVYSDNDYDQIKKYGKLYNWHALNDPRGLAPEGWHIPTDEEWAELNDMLVDGKDALERLNNLGWFIGEDKKRNNAHSNVFGGYRNPEGHYIGTGFTCSWWSSSRSLKTKTSSWILPYKSKKISSHEYAKGFGFAIRCIRNTRKIKIGNLDEESSAQLLSGLNNIFFRAAFTAFSGAEVMQDLSSFYLRLYKAAENSLKKKMEKSGKADALGSKMLLDNFGEIIYEHLKFITNNMVGFNFHYENREVKEDANNWFEKNYISQNDANRIIVRLLAGSLGEGDDKKDKVRVLGLPQSVDLDATMTRLYDDLGKVATFEELIDRLSWLSKRYSLYEQLTAKLKILPAQFNPDDLTKEEKSLQKAFFNYFTEISEPDNESYDGKLNDNATLLDQITVSDKIIGVQPLKEIKIGNQIWVDRNLDVSHFRNGDPIPEARTDEEWQEAGKIPTTSVVLL
jgi:uncharacterized protein (TIGR02145 family)